MPTLSQLPTDNLYKFLALAGCALIVLAVWLLIVRRENLLTRLDTLLMAFARHTAQNEIVSMGLARAKRKQDVSNEQMREIQDQHNVAIRLKDESEAEYKILSRLNAELLLVIRVSSVLLVVGLLISVTGFSLWYNRLQRPQDDLLSLQLRDAMERLPEAPLPSVIPPNTPQPVVKP